MLTTTCKTSRSDLLSLVIFTNRNTGERAQDTAWISSSRPWPTDNPSLNVPLSPSLHILIPGIEWFEGGGGYLLRGWMSLSNCCGWLPAWTSCLPGWRIQGGILQQPTGLTSGGPTGDYANRLPGRVMTIAGTFQEWTPKSNPEIPDAPEEAGEREDQFPEQESTQLSQGCTTLLAGNLPANRGRSNDRNRRRRHLTAETSTAPELEDLTLLKKGVEQAVTDRGTMGEPEDKVDEQAEEEEGEEEEKITNRGGMSSETDRRIREDTTRGDMKASAEEVKTCRKGTIEDATNQGRVRSRTRSRNGGIRRIANNPDADRIQNPICSPSFATCKGYSSEETNGEEPWRRLETSCSSYQLTWPNCENSSTIPETLMMNGRQEREPPQHKQICWTCTTGKPRSIPQFHDHRLHYPRQKLQKFRKEAGQDPYRRLAVVSRVGRYVNRQQIRSRKLLAV
jgi:hypothetical protein